MRGNGTEVEPPGTPSSRQAECRRGSAGEESFLAETLEYFEPAYQLGMTAPLVAYSALCSCFLQFETLNFPCRGLG